MIIELQEGSSLTCEVSGTSEQSLVRFKQHPEGIPSPWMGRAALERALRILTPAVHKTGFMTATPVHTTPFAHSLQHSNLDPVRMHPGTVVFPAASHADEYLEQNPAERPRSLGGAQEDRDNVAELANQLTAAARVAESKKGISERELVDVCRRYIRLFRAPKQALRDALSFSVGLDPERFDHFYAQVTAKSAPI